MAKPSYKLGKGLQKRGAMPPAAAKQPGKAGKTGKMPNFALFKSGKK